MTRQVEERTCDLCGARACGDAGRGPLGWIVVHVQVEWDGEQVVRDRDICPFCREALQTELCGKAGGL